jgi:hypothetical protein
MGRYGSGEGQGGEGRSGVNSARPGPDSDGDDSKNDILKGTTLKIYRFMYKEGRPLGPHEVQRALGLSSVSIPQYHINKLVVAGLVKREESSGRYYVDRLVFENMIRIRRAVIPSHTTYAIFFASTLAILLTILRPASILNSLYLFALGINVAAVLIFAREVYTALARSKT